MNIKLAISGKIASGKDTIGQAIFDHLKKPYTKFALGDHLKNELDEIITYYKKSTDPKNTSQKMNITEQDILTLNNFIEQDYKSGYNNINAFTKTPGVRQALQTLGTDIRRKQHENYWVEKVIETINNTTKQSKTSNSTLLTDLRFPNELEAFNQAGFFTLRLNVTPETQKKRLLQRDKHEVLPQHISETALDNHSNFSYIVDNENISIEELAQTIGDKILAEGQQ